MLAPATLKAILVMTIAIINPATEHVDGMVKTKMVFDSMQSCIQTRNLFYVGTIEFSNGTIGKMVDGACVTEEHVKSDEVTIWK